MAGKSTYTPGSGIEKWLDDRMPIIRFANDTLVDFPTPKNLNYWWTFGAILAVMLVVQIISGIVLAMHYTPHAGLAFDSVELFRRDANFGWLIQNIHMVGASMFFIAVYIHMFRGMYFGSYKAPRELLWILGLVIYLLMMATGFFGYVLPWGQMSFWGATVITNFFSAIPYVGDSMLELLRGGFTVQNATLNRFFSLHYLLPFMIAAVVGLHIWALHVPGNGNPTGVEVKSSRDTIPFHPYYTLKDGFAIIVFFVIFAWFVFYAPNIMGHPDNFTKANAFVTPEHIVPEWYYLPFYAILRAIDFNIGPIDSKLGGVIAMFGSILIMFFLPWLDTSKTRSGNFRPLFRIIFWIFVADTLALGYLGALPAEGIYTVYSKICTAYYFSHFLIILPLVSRIEKPKPLPASISESVLGNHGKSSGDDAKAASA